MSKAIEGLEEAQAMFAALPRAARQEVEHTIDSLASKALAMQQSAVPVATGALKQGLSIRHELDQLRARVGLIGRPASSKSTKQRLARERAAGKPAREAVNLDGLFYGRIVEYGRRAQHVRVIRGTTSGKLARRSGSNRKLRGPYTMHVTALAPRPFIHVEARLETVADKLGSDFWARALDRSGQ